MQLEQLFLTVVQGAQTFVNSMNGGVTSPNMSTNVQPPSMPMINGEWIQNALTHMQYRPTAARLRPAECSTTSTPSRPTRPPLWLYRTHWRASVDRWQDGRIVFCNYKITQKFDEPVQITFLAPLNNVSNLWIVDVATVLREKNMKSAMPLTNDTDDGVFSVFKICKASKSNRIDLQISAYFWTFYPNTLMFKQKRDGDEYRRYYKMGNWQLFQ
jgi:hypothetical protein